MPQLTQCTQLATACVQLFSLCGLHNFARCMWRRYDESLAGVTSALGKCESFLRTPIPLGYTRYSVRFLWIWLTLLPFALTRAFCGFQVGTWWEGKVDEPWPLVCASVSFIAAIFLSIEDISVQVRLREPLGMVPHLLAPPLTFPPD